MTGVSWVCLLSVRLPSRASIKLMIKGKTVEIRKKMCFCNLYYAVMFGIVQLGKWSS